MAIGHLTGAVHAAELRFKEGKKKQKQFVHCDSKGMFVEAGLLAWSLMFRMYKLLQDANYRHKPNECVHGITPAWSEGCVFCEAIRPG